MAHKIISCVTLVAFLVFTQSCTIYKTRTVRGEAAPLETRPGAKVLRVMKISGEVLDFPETNPGYLQGQNIVRYEYPPNIIIKASEVERIETDKDKKQVLIMTKDGRTILGTSYSRRPDFTIIVQVRSPVSTTIPLSEVSMVWVKEVDKGLSVLASVGVTAGVIGGVFFTILLIVALTKESCPFLYSHDGTEFKLEGELYSGAILKGIERTDYLKLHHVNEGTDGYSLKMANEALEVQYTDEVALLVVDHRPGTDVLVGEDGRMHTIRAPQPAAAAQDFKGADFTEALSAKDGRMWCSTLQGRNPDDPEDLKAGVVLQFARPSDARVAKLVVRIGNTYWADYVFGRFLDATGVMNAWVERSDADPLFRPKADMFMKAQGIGLRVQALKAGAWKDLGMFYPTGPFGIEDEVLEFPLEEAGGRTLTLRLDGGAFFWMIDYAAIDFSADEPIEVHEERPMRAVDESGRDVRPSLLSSDDDYQTMPAPGNCVLLNFASPARRPGTDRSFILRSEGYYVFHPRDMAKPDEQTLQALQKDSGSLLRFSLREFERMFSAKMGSASTH